MSTATLSNASTTAIESLQQAQGTSEAVKVSLITEIVDLFASDPAITTEHLLAGKFSRGFRGRVYGARAVHLTGYEAEKVNVGFWADYHDMINVAGDKYAMQAELDRVSGLVKASKSKAAQADAEAGVSARVAFEAIEKSFVKADETLFVATPTNDELIMALDAKWEKIKADYRAAAALQQEDSLTLVNN